MELIRHLMQQKNLLIKKYYSKLFSGVCFAPKDTDDSENKFEKLRVQRKYELYTPNHFECSSNWTKIPDYLNNSTTTLRELSSCRIIL